MNIREIELRSGLERANIRFYEKEGFLTPIRRDNGYRDYSQEDLDTLLRIKLLRRIGLRLDEIRSVQNGEQEMDAVLQRRLGGITEQQRELDAARQVCSQMRQEGARFDTLDAQRYLRAYEDALQPRAYVSPHAVPESDRVEPVRTPWRRFFARALDLTITGLVWQLLLAGLLGVNLSKLGALADWFLGLAGWVLLIPLEAFCLSRWGATPGKWILGLRLEHADGRLLTYREAQARTLAVFGRGEGYTLPVYSLYRNWKSYEDLTKGDGTEWDRETDTVFTAAEYRWPRTAVYLGARILISVLAVLIMMLPARPVHRGADLTVEQFVENYNRAADFYDMDATLQTDGTFASDPDLFETPLVLRFTVEEGILTGISYQTETDSAIWGVLPDAAGKNAVQICVWAFAGADDGLLARLKALKRLDPIIEMKEGSADMELLGCRLQYSITDTGSVTPEGSVFEKWTSSARFSLTK